MTRDQQEYLVILNLNQNFKFFSMICLFGAYDNPTFEYKVPRDTLVYIPIDGIIDFVGNQQQAINRMIGSL